MNPVQMAAEMYDAREVLQRLYGDKYVEKIQPWMGAIRKAEESLKLGTLGTTIQLAKDEGDDVVTTWLLAAYVEMVEPTPT
jgi:hypothetical protein